MYHLDYDWHTAAECLLYIVDACDAGMRCECGGGCMVYYRPAVYTTVILYRQLGNKPGRVLGTSPAVI